MPEIMTRTESHTSRFTRYSLLVRQAGSRFTQHDLAPSLACPRTFDSQPSGRFARLAPTAAPDHQSLTTALSLILPLGRGTEGAKRKLGVVVGSLSAGALLLFGLFALGREVASVLDLDELYRKLPGLIARMTDFHAMAVYLVDSKHRDLRIAYAEGYQPEAAGTAALPGLAHDR